MTADRRKMEAALKGVVVAELRRRGFTGSLPHLRRRQPGRIDLISFQFRSTGGSFVVEVAQCPPDGHTTSTGEHIEPGRVRAQDIYPPQRPRVGSPTFPVGDHWFSFGKRSYEQDPPEPYADEHYLHVAKEVMRLVDQQAEPFWQGRPES